MLSIIIVSIAAAIFYLIGILLMLGKGGFLIAGYHFTPKGNAAKKYHKYLMFRYGLVFLIGIAFVHAILICAFLNQLIAMYVLLGLCIVFLIASALYILCSKKMKQASILEKEETEKFVSNCKNNTEN